MNETINDKLLHFNARWKLGSKVTDKNVGTAKIRADLNKARQVHKWQSKQELDIKTEKKTTSLWNVCKICRDLIILQNERMYRKHKKVP